MHELSLLINIAVALVAAFIGGLLARRIGLPTIVGYLLAGIVIGPFTPGFVGDTETISQLAELGVIFLMFGVGLHFSIRDLWRVRAIAVPGALGQTALATILGFGLSQIWGWTPAAGIVLGLSISVASTVVLLRGLMDHGLTNTPHGQAAIGWLVFEDLLTVLILVLMPTLVKNEGGIDWTVLGLTLLKAAAFVAIVMFAGIRLIPWLLLKIAHTRSRELFILAILAIALGIALGAAEIFGVSLALGAFIAGVVVSESPLSHQVAADVLPFQDAFSVLFFVSVGMLVNPLFLNDNIWSVLALAGLIVIGKPLTTILLGLIFNWPARTSLVVAAGLSQIGEFSFILGQAGIALGLLNAEQYSLILAGALISITLNPFAFRMVEPAGKLFRKHPWMWTQANRQSLESSPQLEAEAHSSGHVVIVDYGRIGRLIANMLNGFGFPLLIVHADLEQMQELERKGIPGLYGDAANSEILLNADLDKARLLVAAGSDESSNELVITTAHDLAPELPIIARAVSRDGVRLLSQSGAQYVIHSELEGGLEILRHTLLLLGFPLEEIYRYTDAMHQEGYDLQNDLDENHRVMHSLIGAMNNIEVAWVHLETDSPIMGQSIAEVNLRAHTGASVVAILRDSQLLANPKSSTLFLASDRVGLIGDKEQIEAAKSMLTSSG